MDLDRFGIVKVFQSHNGLNEEGLGIFKVEVEKGPSSEVKLHGTMEEWRISPYIIANPV